MSCSPTAPGTALYDAAAVGAWASAGFNSRPPAAMPTTRPTPSADTIVAVLLIAVLPCQDDLAKLLFQNIYPCPGCSRLQGYCIRRGSKQNPNGRDPPGKKFAIMTACDATRITNATEGTHERAAAEFPLLDGTGGR